MAEIVEIDERTLNIGVAWLCDRDTDLATIVEQYGFPKLTWLRPPGFATLVFIILEQQVSLASARATFHRLNDAIELTPENLLSLRLDALKSLGFSRQKATYSQNLAKAILNQELNLESLHTMTNETVRAELCKLKGIGPWTADMYLMQALRRTDIFPVGDLALQIAVQRLKGLENRPKGDGLNAIGESWRPWRSVATFLCWHAYLSEKGKLPPNQSPSGQSS